MPRQKLFITLPMALIIAAAFWYMWTIARASLDWGGSSPNQQTLGTVQDIQQRAMAQYCTGVVVSAQGTWLVGRVNKSSNFLKPAAAVQDLDLVVRGTSPASEEEEGSGAFSAYMSSSEAEISFISRLDEHGQFQQVAQISGVACMVASPDGGRVFLLTDVKRPAAASGARDAVSQTVVLHSDDQGKSWAWLRQGFFPEVDSLAYSLRPYFYGADEVWAWSSPEGFDEPSDEQRPEFVPTGVSYSADRGASSRPILARESLLVTLEYARGKRPDILEWRSDAGAHGQIQTQVLQLDAQRAVIWIAQRFWGSNPAGEGDNVAFNVTSRAQLSRVAGQWQVASVQRDDGLFVDRLEDNGAGRVIGLIDQGEHGQDVVAELDRSTQAWKVLSELPSVFSPLASDSRLRGDNFWVGHNSLLINTSSEHRPPHWIYPWSDASISANAMFYSKDWGQSWQQLAIDGYLGTLGFQGAEDRVIWAKGNWYDNNNLGIYSYGLK